jgi:hypothetical protein
MAFKKQNGEATELDIGHELPSAESDETTASQGRGNTTVSDAEAEIEALRAEQ